MTDTQLLAPPLVRYITRTGISNAGKDGVYRVVTPRWPKDSLKKPRIYWKAITPNGIVPIRNRSFSVAKYGEDGAYQLAVATRRAFEAEVEGATKVTPRAPVLPELRGMTRVERKHFGIWQVAIALGIPERTYRKPFSDLFYGSKALALAAATTWRDERMAITRVRARIGGNNRQRCLRYAIASN